MKPTNPTHNQVKVKQRYCALY